jgi:CRP-like cAMP-binding protein
MGYTWIYSIDLRDILGPIGVIGYIGAYLALQLGFIKGDGYQFPTLNLIASSAILVSLTRDFNPYSASIEIAWTSISIIGIARLYFVHRFIKLTEEQAEVAQYIAPDLKKDRLQKLLRLGRVVEVQAGHIVAVQGQQVTDFTILVDGHCHIEKNGFHIASATKGTLLEYLPFTHSVASVATVRIVSPSRLFLIDRGHLQAFLRRNPDAVIGIERCIAVDVGNRLAETTERLSAHMESDIFRHLTSKAS